MITSSSNKKIKNTIALLSRTRERRKQGLFVVEGVKMFLETPTKRIRELYIEETLYKDIQNKEVGSDLIHKIEEIQDKEKPYSFGVSIEVVSTDVFKKMSDTQTPQGILCVVENLTYSLKDNLQKHKQDGLYLILEDIQDPGNLGTMLRAGEGAGISGVIMSDKTVDIYNPKTIRATMGSIYRVPFFYEKDLALSVQTLQKEGVRVYAAHLKGKDDYDRINYKGPVAFMIGNEGNGLTDALAELADAYIKIPMLGSVESLNAAIAATLLTYEAARQRRN